MKIVIFALTSLLSFYACAADKVATGLSIKDNVNTTVIFVNGILNDPEDAAQSSKDLANAMGRHGIDLTKINWKYIWNPTDGGGDVAELRAQASISAFAMDNSPNNLAENYYFTLGRAYTDLVNSRSPWPSSTEYVTYNGTFQRVAKATKHLYDSIVDQVEAKGRKVILVSHSQGNFYVEAIYGLLTYNHKQTVLDNLRVVGVAVVSQTSPSGRYVTIEQDRAVSGLQPFNTIGIGYNPVQSKHKACFGYPCDVGYGDRGDILAASSDVLIHGFVDVYLNENFRDVQVTQGESLPSIIVGMIKASIDELQPQNVTSPVLEAITTQTYELNGSGRCYHKSLPTSQVAPNQYTMTDASWCLNSAGDQWVQDTSGYLEVLLPSGVWAYETDEVIEVVNDTTYNILIAGVGMGAGSVTKTSVGFDGTFVYGNPRYEVWPVDSNSYVFNNTDSIASLISNYNIVGPAGSWLSNGSQYGFVFGGSPVDLSGAVYVFDGAAGPDCSSGTCQWTILATGTWSRMTVGTSDIVTVTIPQSYQAFFGDSADEKPIYVKRSGESGVREGRYAPGSHIERWSAYATKSSFDAFLQGRGLPPSVN